MRRLMRYMPYAEAFTLLMPRACLAAMMPCAIRHARCCCLLLICLMFDAAAAVDYYVAAMPC